ncbi:hypothetical protein BRE01_59740 [Brevibacillus reuszeri]|uniref:DUF3054 domain-containing protein n=1 Tax=Brevibacillus reuszeri TaxID=54915 RepID=A0A0K9YNF6_9BACL|nr:DUF3054 domain-containing protein [Brevibacillus reuszeri]KNB70273.1 hypothetical protein ADS79_15010 [Brevibacillus reuszeri]MED1859232.1 DUF3054 domain-containing protein [Brevibacillus reuszeri]GED72272.1 hypothetical protein BRE01_59740 [Brevibacillus reuszeri]
MRLRILPAGYVLLVGDLVAFLLFVYYGKLAHHLPVTFIGIMETLTPFLIGWIVAMLLFRSYSPRAYETAGRLLLSTLLTWTVAAPIGLVLRAWWTGVPITLIFTAVTYFITLAFLLGWRVPFAIVFALKKRSRRIAS